MASYETDLITKESLESLEHVVKSNDWATYVVRQSLTECMKKFGKSEDVYDICMNIESVLMGMGE